MIKAFITGATGFVGANLCNRLIKENVEVYVLVRETSNTSVFGDFKDKINICKYNGTIETMQQIISRVKPDVVFHLAAYFVAEHNSKDINNLINSNISLGLYLLEAMKNENVKYLINIGTNWQNYNSEQYNPVDLYAATKQAFYDLAKYYTEATELRMITLKLCDTYGPKDFRPKLLSTLNRISETGESLKMSKGEQEMGFVYIDDVIDAIICAMKSIIKMPEHYNEDFLVAPEKFYSLKDVVKVFEDTVNKKVNIEWGKREYRHREVMKISNGKKLEGWNPKIDLKVGMTKTFSDK
ncbi:NAD-dependent epimerase/dehydratase family protein [Clostridium hydrogenum]|uniref:NAD-dependent epimerase/dehydratase family protein n=1 Tax=Clostridium hydrogenum TaxID=2855764 RepID=UPI001F258B53|nr:NAD-dependent epimerase/dehydratase family protein [Clostridium hydrogenum]